ncbi:arylamine N-acetyltransferase 1 [Coleophoma cylindrospora]|uniref:Arylamine N-acetyltransferase 1 n=1 Tax=Coleophoma cylindrospora TaxID=1849047 RepID=A0A3D8QCX9_9HELO|nr:arylamine N-acetyltransferase 1 [Coleophoma cylindrospora]
MSSAYSKDQVDRYFEYISLPARYRREANPTLDLNFLTALHTHQISKVPYENLQLHYSESHAVSLDPHKLYAKIVANARGRGGYCMENSLFFNHVLRAVGFQVFTAGVRIRPRLDGVPQGDYIGWVHIVNIVTLSNGSKYMVDVGFGGDQATKPIPLIDGHVVHNLGTQEVRLIFDTIPSQVDQSRKLWIYQYRNKPEQPWNSFYCFPEFEFLPQDFEIMNYYTSTSSAEANFQTRRVIVVRFLREGEEITGKVMLVDGDVKENVAGKTRLVKTFKTESERVEGLKTIFAIALTDEEIKGVMGRNVELLLPLEV